MDLLQFAIGFAIGWALYRLMRYFFNKPTTYVDDNTAEVVREALYRSGLVKSQVSDAMVEMRKAGIIFFKQTK